MAEGVFTISADITPQIDERELIRQAEQMSKQLNGMLAQKIDKVGIAPATGGFRPFQQEIVKASGAINNFKSRITSIPDTLKKAARSGSNSFMKFADAIDLTRRDMVGFGSSIYDTIRNTERFTDSLDNIRDAGSELSELPERFSIISAQIQSGTSVIDRFAAGGDKMAQMFQPLVRGGEAARTEFVEINQSIDQLVDVVTKFAAASGKGIDVTKDDFDLLGTSINNLEKPFFRVQAILNDTGTSSTEFGKKLRATFQGAAGDPEKMVRAMVALRDQAQKTAGPMGFLAQMLGKVTVEERAAAKAARLELNASLMETGNGNQVEGIQRLVTNFALLREKVSGFVGFFAPVGRAISEFGSQGAASINSVGTSLANNLLGRFGPFRDETLNATEAMNKFGLGATTLEIAGARIQKAMNGAANSLGQFVGGKLASLGSFFTKNLVDPLKAAGPQIKQAFSTIGSDLANGFGFGGKSNKIGSDVVKGIAEGIKGEKASIAKAAEVTKNSVLQNMNAVFGIASPARIMIPKGKNLVEGMAKGVTDNVGILKRALGTLGQVAMTAINPFKMMGMTLRGLKAGFDIMKPAIIGAGVALAGFVTTAAVTGIQFNTLKQVINATLPVVLGSASASRQLLEEVNELNDSSPFARDSFLELTKVLAGFGVQAGKITPLIDAIQQSVAATGGGEQDLLELGQAFAKIQTQGRLTSESLQTFSVRGIDVISLLGASMGKTTGDIKGMISDGLIPAEKALDLLTVALKDKFDGATDAVSKNFPGAMDRMKAKIRDFGGILTAAFVSPEGGGALVDLLNSLASSLSHINKEILPVFRDSLESVGENLSKIGKAVESFVKGISGDAVGAFTSQLGGLLPIFAGVVGFLPGLASGIPVIGGLISGIAGWPLALGLVLATMEPVRKAFGELIKTLGPAIKEFLPKLSSLFKALSDAIGPLVAILMGALGPILTAIMEGFGVLAEALKPIIAYFGRLFKALEPVVMIIKTVIIIAIKNMIMQFRVILTVLDPVVKKIVEFAEKMKPAAEELANWLQELVDSGQIEAFFNQMIGWVEKAIDSLKPLFDGLMDIIGIVKTALDWTGIKISLPDIESATDVYIEEGKKSGDAYYSALATALEKVQGNDLFDSLFGHLDADAKAGAAFQVQFAASEVNKGIDDLLQVMANKDFKAVFGKLPPSARSQAAIMVDDMGDAAEQVLKILNEKDFRKAFGKLDPAIQLVKGNIIQSGRDIQAIFDGATKSIETLTKAIGEANDMLKQAISTAAGVIDGMISASQAVATAIAAVATARQKEADATKTLNDLIKDYARALRDVISPANELAIAERNLTRIRKGLIDLTREEISIGKTNAKLRKEMADLQGQAAAEDRAGLARAEERAQISLNRAKQAELDLLEELNGKQKVSLNLAGLSLDQIRAKLAAARLSSKKEGRDKTPQEIEDLKRSAALDVEDAEQAKKDATEAKGQFEIDTLERIDDIKDEIRDNDERIKEIADDRADQLLDEENALKGINNLRAGETTQQKLILDWDDKINAAKQTQKESSQAIETAITNAAIEQGKFALKTAEAKGDADGILRAHQNLWNLQIAGDGTIFQAGVLRDIMHTQMQNVEKARDAARELKDELAAANKLLGAATALQGLSATVGSSETFWAQVEKDEMWSHGRTIRSQQLDKDLRSNLRLALGSGAIEDKKTKMPVFPSGAEIERIIEEAFRASNIRDGIRDALVRRNWSMPGFAAVHGYAPGDLIHRGMNNGVGVMRWAEFGKEAILPLTRKFDMARVVQSPQVLPAILDALPRWRMPESTNLSDSSVSDLSTMIRSGRSGGGPANSDVYQKKSQREFANTIGNAVYTAVKTAIDESDGLGSDVDINVMPSSSNEKLIAREVKRQVDKALGKKW